MFEAKIPQQGWGVLNEDYMSQLDLLRTPTNKRISMMESSHVQGKHVLDEGSSRTRGWMVLMRMTRLSSKDRHEGMDGWMGVSHVLDGEELLVECGEVEVRRGAAELGQGLHVQEGGVPEVGELGHQDVEGPDIPFVGQLVGLVQLVLQGLQDRLVQGLHVQDRLQAGTVCGRNGDVSIIKRNCILKTIHKRNRCILKPILSYFNI